MAAAREDLSIWVVTGDGDALSIGGNHLIHALRRNIPVKILLFNNQIYGLTKGQASPTSELGKVTKSTPFGSIDGPFNPVSLALGAEASFVARTIDTDKHHLPMVLRAAAEHEGASLVEIYQNCPVFNDGAFDALRDKKQGAVNRIPLEHGKPIRFGVEGENGVVRGGDGDLRIAAVADVGEDALVVHDAHRDDPSLAFALSRLVEHAGRADADRDLPPGVAPGLRPRPTESSRSRGPAPATPSWTRHCTPGTRGPSPRPAAARSGARTRRTCFRRGSRRWTSRSPPRSRPRCSTPSSVTTSATSGDTEALLEAFAGFAARRLGWRSTASRSRSSRT